MDIKIYGSEKCGKCKIIKDKLEKKGVEFYYTDDVEEAVVISEQVNDRRLPLCIVDGKKVEHNEMDKIIRDMRGE